MLPIEKVFQNAEGQDKLGIAPLAHFSQEGP